MILKPKTVNYRRVEFELSAGDHLQKLHLRKLETPGTNVDYRLTAAADTPHHVLSQRQKRRGILCGELLRFEKDRDVPLVDVDPQSGSVWTGAAPPVDVNGTRRNFAESSLYFALKENHLAVIQSMGLGLTELQSFFAWLIGIDINTPDTQGGQTRLFHFRNMPSKGAREAIQGKQVRGIAIGSELFHQSKIPTIIKREGRKDRHINRTEYKIDASMKGILEALMRRLGADDAILDDLDRHADPGSIRMNLEITYVSHSDKEAQELMHTIAGALDGGDFPKASIRLKGGAEIKGEDLTIRETIRGEHPLQQAFSRQIGINWLEPWNWQDTQTAHKLWADDVTNKRAGHAGKRPVADVLIEAFAMRFRGLVTRNPKHFTAISTLVP